MTQPNPLPKTLSFQLARFGLLDSDDTFVSLAELSSLSTSLQEKNFWQKAPWSENYFQSVNLGDLPSRLSGPSLTLTLQRMWQLCADGAEILFRFPHPRHDVFFSDLGYVRGLLPEAFAANQLGVRFEIKETSLTLDPHWQNAINEGSVTYDEIDAIAKQVSNVIQWIDMKFQVQKSLWVQAPSSRLEAGMVKQLQDQLASHEARGDEKSASVLRQFLANCQTMKEA